jgi:Fur family zinc uptake transcriptional regulator
MVDRCHASEPAVHALAAAASLCRERGAQFTEVSRRVLEALWQAGQPLSAYELMPRLETVLKRRLTPPTVYRSLDFLADAASLGFEVHRHVVELQGLCAQCVVSA